MEKEKYMSNVDNVDIKSELPTTDELKNSFREGSIPLEKDFHDLIDIANLGRKAIGQDPGQLDNSETALELDEKSGRLVVKAGKGITVSSNGISVKTQDNGAIDITSDGLQVSCWESGGITTTDSNGLYLKLVGGNNSNSWNGISGLELSDQGVKIKANTGIKVDENGLSVDIDYILSELIDRIIPPGTIMPLYSKIGKPNYDGVTLPKGWAWCDGTNNTPYLNISEIEDSILPKKINLISGNVRASSESGYANNAFEINTNGEGGEKIRIYVRYMRYIIKMPHEI
ncbi:hypothetical protein [Xenorhabdus bovienii]|uniref:hypothetical protein n=1 Tax=Xenorhabdus bovienii TaxID=40576 RepID=UPI00237C882C|nr:hypothetical protein [Xenorhabdus bovienii]MDE1482848.1 hypothetical protein [Xenorhabdus bovienii]MDE9441803.1 hypothetical protein [Xenorhabdus bovienii]